jgi:hypothetical protein
MKYIITIALLVFSLSIAVGQKPKFKKVTQEELELKKSSIDSLAKAEVLYSGCEVTFEYNQQKSRFEIVYRYQKRIKIFDGDFTDISDFSIRYYKGENNSNSEKISKLEAYTFNLDGKKITKEKVSKKNIYDEESNKFYNVRKFAFPAIKDGSILEVKYTLRSHYIFNIDEFYFQENVPVQYSELNISTPEYFNYNSNAKGVIPLDVASKKGYNSYRYSYTVDVGNRLSPKMERRNEKVDFIENKSSYTATNVPAIKNEPFVYSMDNYRSSIGHELLYTNFPRSSIKYYTKTWDDIAELLNDSKNFGSQINAKYKQHNELIEQVSNMGPNQKIETIYNSIRDQYTWNGYFAATTNDGIKDLIKSGTGNTAEINLLLVNLLQKAGINALPMVSRSRSSGFLNISNPTFSQLNYVMVAIENEGSYIYLDATDKNLTVNTIPRRALNLKGILINGKKGTEISMQNPNNGKENRIYTLSIEDQNLKGVYQQTLGAYFAFSTRSIYDTETDLRESLNSEQRSFSNIMVENYSNKNEDIKVKSEIIATGFVQNVEDKIFIDLQICDDEFINPFKAEERNFAIFYNSTYTNVDMFKLKIPEGYKIESIPENLNIATPEKLITVRINFIELSGEVVMTKKTKLAQTIISPEYYHAVKMVYDQVEAKMKEKIVLAKL